MFEDGVKTGVCTSRPLVELIRSDFKWRSECYGGRDFEHNFMIGVCRKLLQ